MKIVSAAIIVKDGHIFIAQRPDGKSLANYWELPGGKQEAFETIEECLEREISEEFNAKVKCGEFFMSSAFDYEFGTILLKAFFAELLPGQELQPLEHKNTAWVTPQELSQYTFAPADTPIIEELKNIEL